MPMFSESVVAAIATVNALDAGEVVKVVNAVANGNSESSVPTLLARFEAGADPGESLPSEIAEMIGACAASVAALAAAVDQ